jgi:polysaccharide deacetylase family protein (PEP-CTERM system associated)
LRPTSAALEWDAAPCRVERNVERILQLLAERGCKATFFTLGWIAERYPQLVRASSQAATNWPAMATATSAPAISAAKRFAQDVSRAKKLLEDITRHGRAGYRAPSFSIGTGNLWAFDALAQAGYRYSSSVYPIQHDHYGMPDSPRFAYRVGTGLLEVPSPPCAC